MAINTKGQVAFLAPPDRQGAAGLYQQPNVAMELMIDAQGNVLATAIVSDGSGNQVAGYPYLLTPTMLTAVDIDALTKIEAVRAIAEAALVAAVRDINGNDNIEVVE